MRNKEYTREHTADKLTTQIQFRATRLPDPYKGTSPKPAPGSRDNTLSSWGYDNSSKPTVHRHRPGPAWSKMNQTEKPHWQRARLSLPVLPPLVAPRSSTKLTAQGLLKSNATTTGIKLLLKDTTVLTFPCTWANTPVFASSKLRSPHIHSPCITHNPESHSQNPDKIYT